MLRLYQRTDLACEVARVLEAAAVEASEMQGGSCLGPDRLTGAAAAACLRLLAHEL